MQRSFLWSLVVGMLLLACSSDNYTYENPNLLDVKVDFTVNLALPQYNPLTFTMQPVMIRGYGSGGKDGGVILTKTGTDTYVAYDARDPNNPAECGVLSIKGHEGVSGCSDHNTYNLISGTPIESKSEGEDLEFSMKPYQVIDMGGGILRVKN